MTERSLPAGEGGPNLFVDALPRTRSDGLATGISRCGASRCYYGNYALFFDNLQTPSGEGDWQFGEKGLQNPCGSVP